MPSGKTHNLINLVCFGVLSSGVVLGQLIGALHVSFAQSLLFSACYMIGTFFLSPDLDLASGNVNSKRYWGALGFLWVPYSKLFRHRGMSHTWVVGPLTRLIYLALLLMPVYVLLWYWPGGLWWLSNAWQGVQSSWLIAGLLGYYFSQWLHLIADGISPRHDLEMIRKKIQRSSSKKRKKRR